MTRPHSITAKSTNRHSQAHTASQPNPQTVRIKPQYSYEKRKTVSEKPIQPEGMAAVEAATQYHLFAIWAESRCEMGRFAR